MTPQQRKLFVMFADISGSAQLYEHLGDTEAMHAIERCLKRMNRSVDSYHGRIAKTVGDELLASFDTVDNACHAAIDMQQRVADIPPISGLKLSIRIGLHVGMVTDEDGILGGDTVTSAARIVGAARRDQILASAELISELGLHSTIKQRPMPDLGGITQNGRMLDIAQIEWSVHPVPGQFSVLSIMPATRFSVSFRGQTHLLDDKLRVLTIGRDLGNRLHVDDRKASRLHARIEKRNSGYYLVDSSTNGSFVTFSGRQEVLVRHNEILLDGQGSICFGASKNDPTAICAEFELL